MWSASSATVPWVSHCWQNLIMCIKYTIRNACAEGDLQHNCVYSTESDKVSSTVFLKYLKFILDSVVGIDFI